MYIYKTEKSTISERISFVAGTGFSRFAIGPDVDRGVDQKKFGQTEKV